MTFRKEFLSAPIFTRTYTLCVSMLDMQFAISKEHRYAIWATCMDFAYELLCLVIKACIRKEGKLPVLQEMNETLEQLKVFIRLAHRQKAIPQEKYLQFQEDLQEIGKMLGGWIRTFPSQASL